MRDLPGACEVNDADESAGDRVVYRRAGTDPFAVVITEVLEREHLHRAIFGQRRTDAVRAVDRFAAARTLDEIHSGSQFLQRLRAAQKEGEPGRIGHLDHAVGLHGQHLKWLYEHVPEQSERMLEPALPRL